MLGLSLADLPFIFSPLTYVPTIFLLLNPPQFLPTTSTFTAASKPPKSAFSPLVHLSLLLAHLLRVFCHLLTPLQPSIAFQSYLMLLVQSAILIAHKIRSHKSGLLRQLLVFLYSRPGFPLLILFLLISLVDLAFVSSFAIPPLLMTASLMLEAAPPAIQYVKIARAGTSRGVSRAMVLSWLLGDACKVVYFGAVKGEGRMAFGGAVAAVADAVVVGRVWK